jgi:hypothetical protein
MAEEMAVYAEAVPEGLAAFLGCEFTEPGDYLHGTIFNLLGSLLLVAAAATFGAAAIAGEGGENPAGAVQRAAVAAAGGRPEARCARARRHGAGGGAHLLTPRGPSAA